MKWIRPEYQEIALSMEVTAYVNTDTKPVERPEPHAARAAAEEEPAARG